MQHEMHEHAGHEDHASHDHSHHDPRKFRNQFWVAFALTIPTMLYSGMLQNLLNFQVPVFAGSVYVSAILGTVILVTGGRIFIASGVKELQAKKPGMMALIAMALVVSFSYSAFLTVGQLIGFDLAGMDFWWELAALVSIMLLGHWIEMAQVAKAQNAMGALASLLPDTAIVLRGSVEKTVPVSELRVGDRIVVRPGTVIAADGLVYKGTSSVDESMLTGESRAVAKDKGSVVIAGTINAQRSNISLDDDELGTLRVEITALGDSTMLSGILKLVAQAQQSKSNTQRLADRAASWLFYVALGSAAITAAVWPFIGGTTDSFVLERVVTVLVIACPHALGLAIPLVSSITGSVAAGQGVLIRDRIAFEALRKADVILFDKTGTLTTGERSVASVTLTKGSQLKSANELLAIAAAIEHDSDHALAVAINRAAKANRLRLPDVRDVMLVPGVGLGGRLAGSRVMAGGPALLTKNNIKIDVSDLFQADQMGTNGATVVFIVRDNDLLGMIGIADTVREGAAEAVATLRKMGKRVAMLSGDSHGAANSIAKQLGIKEVFAEVLPAQKSEVVAKLQADKSTVVMVGDGVNDAPALALANVGIAIGTGTDVAIEVADVILVKSDVLAVPAAIKLAKRSYGVMVQNLWWAAGYNILAIPLAAGAFSGIGLVLTPAVGAVLMSLSTIIVAANAQKLRKEARR
jgi:Cu2+-exporting ATPase